MCIAVIAPTTLDHGANRDRAYSLGLLYPKWENHTAGDTKHACLWLLWRRNKDQHDLKTWLAPAPHFRFYSHLGVSSPGLPSTPGTIIPSTRDAMGGLARISL